MYEQLQDILNKCIEKGWEYHFINGSFKFFLGGYGIFCNKIITCGFDLGPRKMCISYHDLFSKDSGIMEFVEWVEPTIQYEMIDSFAETDNMKNHYIIMSTMTAEEKVKYFIDNVIV